MIAYGHSLVDSNTVAFSVRSWVPYRSLVTSEPIVGPCQSFVGLSERSYGAVPEPCWPQCAIVAADPDAMWAVQCNSGY